MARRELATMLEARFQQVDRAETTSQVTLNAGAEVGEPERVGDAQKNNIDVKRGIADP